VIVCFVDIVDPLCLKVIVCFVDIVDPLCLKVIVCFVDIVDPLRLKVIGRFFFYIGGIVDHHYFLYIIICPNPNC
jgi:hypothetical protein